MPLTLPTHPVAVLPIKMWRPDRFDGVALVLGSIAPDVGYAFLGYGLPLIEHGHAWHALLWWSLPLTLLGTWLVRWAAPVVAAHLPGPGRDFAVLGEVRRPWWVTVRSALLGAATHLAWDSFTHATLDGRLIFPALHRVAFDGRPWWDVLSSVSDLVGAVLAVVFVILIGHRRLLVRWHGPASPPPARRMVFWSAVAVTMAVLLSLLPLQPARSINVDGVRALLAAGIALLVGRAAYGLSTRAATARP